MPNVSKLFRQAHKPLCDTYNNAEQQGSIPDKKMPWSVGTIESCASFLKHQNMVRQELPKPKRLRTLWENCSFECDNNRDG